MFWQVMQKLHLKATPAILQRVQQLVSTIKSSTVVCVSGEAGSGKTTLWQIGAEVQSLRYDVVF